MKDSRQKRRCLLLAAALGAGTLLGAADEEESRETFKEEALQELARHRELMKEEESAAETETASLPKNQAAAPMLPEAPPLVVKSLPEEMKEKEKLESEEKRWLLATVEKVSGESLLDAGLEEDEIAAEPFGRKTKLIDLIAAEEMKKTPPDEKTGKIKAAKIGGTAGSMWQDDFTPGEMPARKDFPVFEPGAAFKTQARPQAPAPAGNNPYLENKTPAPPAESWLPVLPAGPEPGGFSDALRLPLPAGEKSLPPAGFEPFRAPAFAPLPFAAPLSPARSAAGSSALFPEISVPQKPAPRLGEPDDFEKYLPQMKRF